MKSPREIFKAAIRKTGIARRDVATCAGISMRSLENLLSGAQNRRARQAVTNLCGVTIWKGMPPTERVLIFGPGVEMDFSGCGAGEKYANEWAAELGDRVATRDGAVVRFLRPTAMRVSVS